MICVRTSSCSVCRCRSEGPTAAGPFKVSDHKAYLSVLPVKINLNCHTIFHPTGCDSGGNAEGDKFMKSLRQIYLPAGIRLYGLGGTSIGRQYPSKPITCVVPFESGRRGRPLRRAMIAKPTHPTLIWDAMFLWSIKMSAAGVTGFYHLVAEGPTTAIPC